MSGTFLSGILGETLISHIDNVASFLDFYGDALVQWTNPTLTSHLTKDWPLASFSGAFATVFTYFLVVMIGSSILKAIYGSKEKEKDTSKPSSLWQKLRNEPVLFIVLIYNPIQVILCAYIFYTIGVEVYTQGYKIICNDFHQERTGLAFGFWLFYLSKVLDYFDTAVIIMRRKWRQLSFLHVYHHISIFLFCWLSLRTGYDGDVYYTVQSNCFVHMVMYSYYQCATLDIKVPKSIKMLVTKIQMIQFVTMNAQAIIGMSLGSPYPVRLTAIYLVYIFSLLVLFMDFSKKEYKEPTKQKPIEDDKATKKTQ